MASTSPEPGTIISKKYIKYEVHRKYITYLFKVFMASTYKIGFCNAYPKT